MISETQLKPGGAMRADSFTVGTPVLEEHFYGRESELKTLMNYRWIWICGQRRIGKTSLLKRCEMMANKRGWIPLYLSLEVIDRDENSSIFFTKFLRKNRRMLKPLKITEEIFEGLAGDECFNLLVEELNDQSKQVMFLWDEADRLIDIAKMDPGFLNSFRGYLHSNPNFRLAIAATQGLAELFPKDDRLSDFITSFKWMPLKGLAYDDAHAVMQCNQTGGWDHPIDKTIVDRAVGWSGGHPWVLQELGSQLQEKTGGDGRKATFDMLDQICRNAFGANPGFKRNFKDDQRKMTMPQHSVLSAVANQNESINTRSKLLEWLNDIPFSQVQSAVEYLTDFGYLKQVVNEEDIQLLLGYPFYTEFLTEDTSGALFSQESVERIKPTLFISYAHEDSEQFDLFMKFINPAFQSKHCLSLWVDNKIKLGEKWDDSIKDAMQRSDLGLFLVSQNLLTSNYISKVEAPTLIEKAMKNNRFHIVPFFISHSTVEEVVYEVEGQKIKLTKFQGVNEPKRPLESLKKAEKNRMLSEITSKIISELESIRFRNVH